jgi:signal transduction histidine kinase
MVNSPGMADAQLGTSIDRREKSVAPSSRLTIFDPKRVWLVFTGFMLVISVVFSSGLIYFASMENQKLVDAQLEALLRLRVGDIERLQYRDFMEGASRELGNLYLQVSTEQATLTHGKLVSPMHCASQTVGITNIKMCRPFKSPVWVLTAMLSIFAFLSLIGLRAVVILERNSSRQLCKFLSASGVNVDSSQGLFGILSKIKQITDELLVAKQREVELAQKAALSDLAAQVAHDIRSPLCALNIVADHFTQIPADARSLVEAAVRRIQEICDQMLIKYREKNTKQSPEIPETHQILPLVQTIISEKELQKTKLGETTINTQFDDNAANFLANIQPIEFKRVLSNLIDNSIEASDGHGHIAIELTRKNGKLLLSVADTGKGIPKDRLSELGQHQASYGKQSGTGLGLYHAKRQVKSWDGTLTIDSEVGSGTRVEIELPLV